MSIYLLSMLRMIIIIFLLFVNFRWSTVSQTSAIGQYTDSGMCASVSCFAVSFRSATVFMNQHVRSYRDLLLFHRPDKGIDCNSSWHFNSSKIEVQLCSFSLYDPVELMSHCFLFCNWTDLFSEEEHKRTHQHLRQVKTQKNKRNA